LKSFARSSSFRIEFNAIAARHMLALDPVIRDRIDRFLSVAWQETRNASANRWKAGFWRYKIGTYRIICRIEKRRLPS